MPTVQSVDALRANLSAELRAALKQRDALHIKTLRALLHAMDNASAVPTPAGLPSRYTGPSEVPRRELTLDDVRALFRAEMLAGERAALELERAGAPERAAELRAQAALMAQLVP